PILRHVTVAITGQGEVRSSPGGLDCPANCAADFADGSAVSFTAVPAAGWDFAGFGGACSGARAAEAREVPAGGGDGGEGDGAAVGEVGGAIGGAVEAAGAAAHFALARDRDRHVAQDG